MRSLGKVKPAGRGIGVPLPEAGGMYVPLMGNIYWHQDDFQGAALDGDEWVASAGGTAGTVVGSSLFSIDSSTATGSTTTVRLYSAESAGGNMYSIPFRATFNAAVYATAGAGVAPTGGLDLFFRVWSTGNTHIAQFHLDLTTAGSSSLASPRVLLETRASSTAAAFINDATTNPFTTAANRILTATGLTDYTIEMTHRGVAFYLGTDPGSGKPPRLLKFFSDQMPRHDLNYVLEARLIPDGTAGYTQTAGIQVDIDYVKVEQFAPFVPWESVIGSPDARGDVRTSYDATPSPSADGLVTSGAGTLLGLSWTTTSTTGTDYYAAAYDASAASTAIYDYGEALSAGTKLLWIQQLQNVASGGGAAGNLVSPIFPAGGIPFYRGLLVADVNVAGTAVGASALNILSVYEVKS